MPVHTFDPPSGRTELFAIDSRALSGNLLGDPSRRSVAIHLPAGYDHGSETYPLLVDLAAFTSSGLKRLAWQAFGESVPQRLERLEAEGRMGPVIAAFPDCFTSLGGNQYVDSPVMGRWEEFLIAELLPEITRRYRVRPGPAHRAVYGKSSGGYGALVQGLRHGAEWAAVACHSGDMGFDLVYRRDLARALDELARHGGDVPAFLAHTRASDKLGEHEVCTLMMLALAASYDPEGTAPGALRLPVDHETCEIDPERWPRWLVHDPVQMIERPACQASLRRLRGLFLDCGRQDPYFLHYGARAFARRLRAHGIPHRYEEFDGGHSGIDHRLDVSLPFLYAAISGPG